MPKPVRDTKENTMDFSPLKETDDSIVTFWWSDSDWRWWPYTLGEAREDSNNPNMSMAEAEGYAKRSFDLPSYRDADGQMKADGGIRKAAGGQPGSRNGPQEKERFGDSGFEDTGGGGGRGGGGGAAPQVYAAPNRDEIEDQIKSYIVATTGKNDAALLNKAVNEYLKADKAAWKQQVDGKGGERPSPTMAAKNVVRATDEYKTIHYLRPDSVDEMDWVTGAQGKLRQLGVSAARSEELGIRQASVGATDKDLVGASEVSLQSNNKLMADSQRAKLKQSVSAVARMIK